MTRLIRAIPLPLLVVLPILIGSTLESRENQHTADGINTENPAFLAEGQADSRSSSVRGARAPAIPTPLADVTPDPSYFDGARRDTIVWTQPQPMSAWSIVAVVRPTADCATGSSRTVVTNDSPGWNDDVLFGICPEVPTISDAGKWAVIHQDASDLVRTIAVVEGSIIGDRWYHVAATSNGEYLRFYVNGLPSTYCIWKTGADLNFGYANTYIGGSINAGGRYFEGNIASVKIYDTTLSEDDIEALAAAENLLDYSNPSLELYVDNIVVDSVPVEIVTSIDFVNGNEVITDLGNDRFLFRPVGGGSLQVAETLASPLDRQHSITWSNSVTPPRYFVADTDNHRIVSFESLTDSAIYSETSTIADSVLTRPHDLEYNPADGYFYGVTAPMDPNSDQFPKFLFRFRDIGVDEGVLLMAPPGVTESEFYMRSLSVVDSVVYVVNSRGYGSHPQVIRIDDFGTGTRTTYNAHSSFAGDLQAIEFLGGWWYGTGGYTPDPFLVRWRSWDEFENGEWDDLSDLVDPISGGGNTIAYFLTRWNGRVFFPVYVHKPTEGESWYDRIFEIVFQEPALLFVPERPDIPHGTALIDNYPNPFTTVSGTHIIYTVESPGRVELRIFDSAGRLVRTLAARASIGQNSNFWDGRADDGTKLSCGVYFCELNLRGGRAHTKMILIE